MTTTTHHMSLCIAGALRSFTRDDWESLFTDGAGNAVPADVARAQMQQRLDAGEALFPLGVCEGFSPQTGCPGHPVETPARPAAMTAPIIPADQWPEWADRHCWDKRGIGQFIGIQTDKYSWRKWAANSGIPLPAGHDWRVPVMRPTCKESLPVAPAIDPGQSIPGIFNNSDTVAVPREMISAAIGAILHAGKYPAVRTLAQLRRYTIGDLSKPQPQPAIDLEQFREAVTYFRDAYAASSLGPDSWQSAKAAEADRLLALIDGSKNNNLPHVGDTNVVVSQPAKGEGE